MKRTLFVMIAISMLLTGCKKKESKSEDLVYNDKNPIEMVLQGTHKIAVESDYDITYTILNTDPNKTVLKLKDEGTLYGFNVGHDKVKIDNGYHSKTVDVNVDLFKEPSFEFGCTSSRIRQLFGNPVFSTYINDTTLFYRYTSNSGYSYACGEIDFYFINAAYIESDVYIKPSVENPLLYNYLNDKFDLYTQYNDTVMTNYSDAYCQQHGVTNHLEPIVREIYKQKSDETIVCVKQPAFNDWSEILLYYFQVEPDEEKSLDNCLKMHPRSSKFRY